MEPACCGAASIADDSGIPVRDVGDLKVGHEGASQSMKPSTTITLRHPVVAIAMLLSSAVAVCPATSSAASVDSDNPVTRTNGNDVFVAFSDPERTTLRADLSNTLGITLSMQGSFTQNDEFFFFTLKNLTGSPITKLDVGFFKEAGTRFQATPVSFLWYRSIAESFTRATQFDPTLKVDWGGVEIVETDTSFEAAYPFEAGHEWLPGMSLYFKLRWYGFYHHYVSWLPSNSRDWVLTIDPTGIDDVLVEPVLNTPIPGAVWLFGTGWIVLSAFRRKRSQT